MRFWEYCLQTILFAPLQKLGVYRVNYLQQPYLLQVKKHQQILWPQNSTAIYYRKQHQAHFLPVPVQIRSFVQDYLRSFSQFVNTLVADEDLTFGVITDTHIKFADSHSYYGFNGLQHVGEFLTLPNLINLDFVAHLGDIIDGSDDAVTDRQLLAQVSRYFSQQAGPYFITKGNHDDNDKYDEHTLSKKATFAAQTFADLIWQTMYQQRSVKKLSTNYGVSYFDKNNLRVVFINTTDVPYHLDAQGRKIYDSKLTLAVRNGQLKEIVQILQQSANKKIIVCGHGNLMTVKGNNGLQYNGKAVHDLFKAFNQGLSGSLQHQDKDNNFSLALDFDFTNNLSGQVVAYICGHRHVEDQFKIDGIQYILLNVSALMGKKHSLTTKYNRSWDRKKDEVSEFAGYVINLNQAGDSLKVFGYGAATPLRKFKI
jgi:predicted phosphodiesterase